MTLLLLEIFLRIFPDHDLQTNDSYKYTKKIGRSAFQEPFHSMQELYPALFDVRGYYAKSGGIIRYDFDQLGGRWLRPEIRDTNGYNVFVLGDSFTLGFGLRYEDTYIYKLQEELRKQKIPVNLWNFAMLAAESRKCLWIYQKCSGRIEHDIVLYGLNMNDLVEFPTSYVSNITISIRWRFLLKRSRLFYFFIKKWNTYLDRKRKIAELTSPEVFQKPYFRSNLDAIIELDKEVRKKGMHLRVIILPILIDLKKGTFRPVFQTIMDDLKARKIEYYDLTSVLPPRTDSDYWIMPIDQHPNEKANAIFANRLASYVLQDPALGPYLQRKGSEYVALKQK